MSNVVKFPYSVSRRVFARKPRTSQNGTPEERAAKVAQEMTVPAADIAFIGNAKPDPWAEVGVILSKLNVKGLLPEAVKCLQQLLTRNVSAAVIVVRQRQRQPSGSHVASGDEIVEKFKRLTESNQVYMSGYIQGLVDARKTGEAL
jgi:hypothetical protein